MQQINFPSYTFRFKNSENGLCIFDPIRKKFVRLLPEEWVRQHVVQYLLRDKGYPKLRLRVEGVISVHGMKKRCDIVLYEPDGTIFLVVECKSPAVSLDQSVFDQLARYNLALNAKMLMVTNGLQHYYCTLDYEKEKYCFVQDIPDCIR